MYTFLPADGIFYSPFGWGFYSPIYVYRSPFFFYGYYGRPQYFWENSIIRTDMVSSPSVDFMEAVFME